MSWVCYHALFIHSGLNGDLNVSIRLVLVNNRNAIAQVCVCISALRCLRRHRTAGLMLNEPSKEHLPCFPQWLHHSYPHHRWTRLAIVSRTLPALNFHFCTHPHEAFPPFVQLLKGTVRLVGRKKPGLKNKLEDNRVG